MPRSISATARWPYRAGSRQAALRHRWQRRAAVAPQQLGTARSAKTARAGSVVANPLGQLPEVEVHLGGHVVRQPAQHALQLTRPWPRHAATGGTRQHQTRRPGTRTLRHQQEQVRPSSLLDVVEPLLRGRVGRAGCSPAQPPFGPRDRPIRQFWMGERRPPRAPAPWPASEHRQCVAATVGPTSSSPANRGSSPSVFKHGGRPRLHHAEGCDHGPAADRLRSTPVTSMKSRCPGACKAVGPATARAGGIRRPGDRGADQPEGRQAHRGDRPGQALRQGHAHEDPQARPVRLPAADRGW